MKDEEKKAMPFLNEIDEFLLDEWNSLINQSDFNNKLDKYDKDRTAENIIALIQKLVEIAESQILISEKLTQIILERLRQEINNLKTDSHSLLASSYVSKLDYLMQINHLTKETNSISTSLRNHASLSRQTNDNVQRFTYTGMQPWRFFSNHRILLRSSLTTMLTTAFYFINEQYIKGETSNGKWSLVALQLALVIAAHRIDYKSSPALICEQEKKDCYLALREDIQTLEWKLAETNDRINKLLRITDSDDNQGRKLSI